MGQLIERVNRIVAHAQIFDEPLGEFVNLQEEILDSLFKRFDEIFGEPDNPVNQTTPGKFCLSKSN